MESPAHGRESNDVKVYSQLIAASLENKSSNYSAGVIGRIWWNTTTGKVTVDDGTLVRSLLRNDQKCVFGNSGTASLNTRLNRSAANALQFVTGDDVTAEGSTSTSCAQIDARAVNYTTGGLPAAAAGNAGRIAFDTSVGSLKFDNGGTWTAVASGATTNRVAAVWTYVLGSAAQVTSGAATHSSNSTITLADNDTVLILPGYSASESWTISKKVSIRGLGNASQITGSVTFATGSNYANIGNIRITTGITINSGVVGVVSHKDVYFPTGITFTDNSTALANDLNAMQET
jgi:hypothetical protein